MGQRLLAGAPTCGEGRSATQITTEKGDIHEHLQKVRNGPPTPSLVHEKPALCELTEIVKLLRLGRTSVRILKI